jgi:hypothetical protein
VPLADEGQAGFKPLKVKETKDQQGLKAAHLVSFGGATKVVPLEFVHLDSQRGRR